MGFLNNIFKKNNVRTDEIDDLFDKARLDLEKEKLEQKKLEEKKLVELEKLKKLNLKAGEITKISDADILDTSSLIAIKKLQHNLEVLINKTKEEGKIDKFMIIREDDFFPDNWMWEVNSKNTHLEKYSLPLSTELRKIAALEKAGFDKTMLIREEEMKKALNHVDKDIGSILIPVHFRSTKHFTINTPVEATGDYNPAQSHRNFTIIDTMDSFLTSGYAYSIAWHDAYLDVAHESLTISKNAVVLIEESKYHKIIEDPDILSKLKERKVVVYRGKESVAINMILSEMGVLPSQMDSYYARYDKQLQDILQNSIQGLAKRYHLLYDKSHGGEHGHFTNYFDEKDINQNKSLNDFVTFLVQKFPNCSEIITLRTITDSYYAEKIVQVIGTEALLSAINEYNQMVQNEFDVRSAEYKKNRKTITPEISAFFKNTLFRINQYYEMGEFDHYSYENQKRIEQCILRFFQDSTIQEQILAAKNLTNLLSTVNLETNFNSSFDNSFSLK